MTEDRISELRALCTEYARIKSEAESSLTHEAVSKIATYGMIALEAIPELLDYVQENRVQQMTDHYNYRKNAEVLNINLDDLMRMHDAATPGPWSHRPDKALYVERLREIIAEDETHVCSFTEKVDAAYIVAACNAVSELVQRIRELEAQCDWLAQAAANAGWEGND